MSIASKRQLEVTRKKLKWLEERLAQIKARPVDNPNVRELTIRSFVGLINQMKEEIARIETRITTQARQSQP